MTDDQFNDFLDLLCKQRTDMLGQIDAIEIVLVKYGRLTERTRDIRARAKNGCLKSECECGRMDGAK